MKAYTEPKICPSDLDMSKIWQIQFRWTDPITKKRTPFKIKGGLNRIKNKRERIEQATIMVEVFKENLSKGWDPTKPVEEFLDNKTLLQWFDTIIELKARKKPSTKKTYSSKLRTFKQWCASNGLTNVAPRDFTKAMGRSYFDSLIKTNSGKSFNNHLSVLNMFLNSLVEREVLVKNPLKGIEEEEERSTGNVPYTKEEQTKLKNYLWANNKRMYYAAQFVYYCFLRRTEIIKLKVGHIDWTNKTITIPAEASKNNKSESVTIPRSFEKILLEMGLDMAPKDYYIFGYHFKTCARPILKADSLTMAHRKAMDAVGIGHNKGFYSYKHTGVCDLYNAIKDPYVVMRQCRHSELKITMIYLRSLGLSTDERIREAVYNF